MIRYGSIATLIFTLMSASSWPSTLAAQSAERHKSMSNNITIRIGDQAFSATLSENPTAAAFKKLLPLLTTMTELNGNEKFARLPGTMPVSSVNVFVHTSRGLDAVRVEHSGPLLQVILNHIQLLEDRAG
jgi:hypothetical protein